MTRERKTVAIVDLIDTANAMLADSIDECRDGRIAIAVYLERILMDANAYRGFRFIDGTDETRRSYYVARELRS